MKRLLLAIAILLPLLFFAYWLSERLHIVQRPYVLYIGDSLCEATHDDFGHTLTRIASIAADCKGGRKSIEYGDIPQGKTVIFYALGSNDAGEVPVGSYAKDLQQKLTETDAQWIVCVLPDPQKPVNSPYRQAMQDFCPNTIEPRKHGYLFSAEDGVHGSVEDHRRFGRWLSDYVDRLLEEEPWEN